MIISHAEYRRRIETAFARNPDAPVGSIASEIVRRELEEEARAHELPELTPLCAIEHQILDVLAAHRDQDGQPEGMWVEDLERAISLHGVHGVFSIIDGLCRAGYILYEFRRGGRYGDAAYYRISERALPAEVQAEEDEEFPF